MALDFEEAGVLFDAGKGMAVGFDESGVGSAAAQGLEAHGARACVEVQEFGIVDVGLEDIEDGLAHDGERGAGLLPFGGFEEAVAEFTADDSSGSL